MTTPREFALKTDSSWVYPKEMYVYNGSDDKVVEEVYVWTGSEAVLVWPVPGYAPGAIHGTEGSEYPIQGPSPADYKVFVPVFSHGYDSGITIDSAVDLQTMPAGDLETLNVGAEWAPDGTWDTDAYGGGAGTMFQLFADYQTAGTPYAYETQSSTPLAVSSQATYTLMNLPDTEWSGSNTQNQWRLETAAGNVPFSPWNYSEQADRPISIPMVDSLTDLDGTPGGAFEWDRTANNFMGGLDYMCEMGMPMFVLKLNPSQSLPIVATNVSECAIEDFDINVTLQAGNPLYDGNPFVSGLDYTSELNNDTGLAAEPFPQGVDSANWGKVEPWVPNAGDLEGVLSGVDTSHEFSADPNISSISYKKLDGTWMKIRFDNIWGHTVPSETDGAKTQWCSGGNTSIIDKGGMMINYMPWKKDPALPATAENRTLFKPEYSEFLARMSNPSKSITQNADYVFGGYDYWAENFERADWSTTRPFGGNNVPQRMQGMLIDNDNMTIEMRKPFSEARLLWEEVGCRINNVSSHGVTDPAAHFDCAVGTVTSYFPSANTSMTRYQSHQLPRYFRDGFLQFQYDDYNCTNGDFTNYDGDFQEDFFNRSPYVELRIYNRTTGEWMRSHAWGDMPKSGNSDSDQVTSTTAYAYGSYSRLRPIFLMNPEDGSTPGASNRWTDFFNDNDIIDFKLYSR